MRNGRHGWSVDQTIPASRHEPRDGHLGPRDEHRELRVGHHEFRIETQRLPDDHPSARLSRLGRPFGRDESHAARRRLPSRMLPTMDVRLGSGRDQKLGGVASRQPIGPYGGQNPMGLPENEKRTPEGVLFL
jgi:hypothetical protein